MTQLFCSRLNDFKATAIVEINHDENTCSAKSICDVCCGFQDSEVKPE